MTFERKLGRKLNEEFPEVIHYTGKWLEFVDSNGRGFAQPDHYFVLANRVVVFEAKLTQCVAGLTQLEQLYFPLLSHIYAKPCVGILVCRNLIEEPAHELKDFAEAIVVPPGIYTQHWLGR